MISTNHGHAILLSHSKGPIHVQNRMFIIFCLSLFVVSACDKGESPAPTPPAPKGLQLATSTTLGSYLTDSNGRAVYLFSNDGDGKNNCVGGCATVWPPYYGGEDVSARLGTGLNASDFATITSSTGIKQTTYKTWPIYYYAPAGVAEGNNTTTGDAVGNVWYVAKPDYTIMFANWQLVGSDGKNYLAGAVEGTGKTVYFTDGNGLTLYAFSKDSSMNNNFTKPDFSNDAVWPLYQTDKIVVPSTLDKTLFGSIDVFGKKQLTYKGWPLYYFGSDNHSRGSNKGVAFPAPGIWPIVQKDTPAAPVP